MNEEERKRIELITKPPIQYLFLRVKTGLSKVPQLNIFSPFTNEEIYIAKKCIINKLARPPNYDLPDIRD